MQTVTKMDLLTIQTTQSGSEYRITLEGKSILKFGDTSLLDYFYGLLNDAVNNRRDIHLDLAAIRYLNATTLGQIIKIISLSRRSGVNLRLTYDSGKKWQDKIFSAFSVFHNIAPSFRVEKESPSSL